MDVPITIACGNYDRTQAIKDGVVKVEGCAVTYLPLYPEEIFFRAFRYQEFDVSELSFSSYIRTVATGTSAYIGIPAFVSRIFRHSGIYIRRGRRHPHAGRSAGQAHRAARIPDHRGGLDARHAAARIRRASIGDSLAQRRPGGAGAARAHPAQADQGHRPAADRRHPDPRRHAGERRARRPVHRARAVVVPARRAAYRAAVCRHTRRPRPPISRRPACFRSCT